MGDDDQAFKQCLESLSTELYACIYSLTFTNTSDHCISSKTYLPPANLQVSQDTRRLAAREFYGDTRFGFASHNDCLDWTLSLPDEHFVLLQEVDEFVAYSWGLNVFTKMKWAQIFWTRACRPKKPC